MTPITRDFTNNGNCISKTLWPPQTPDTDNYQIKGDSLIISSGYSYRECYFIAHHTDSSLLLINSEDSCLQVLILKKLNR